MRIEASRRVFVTGGTGYVGAHVVRTLLARGHEVTLLVRDRSKLEPFGDVAHVLGDVRDAAPLEAAMRNHDALVHAAIVWDEAPTELELVDPRASIGVFLAAARAGVRDVAFVSSTAVHRPFRAHMTESDALAPTDFYGVAKATGELALSAIAHEHGLRAVVLRAGPVVGAPAFPDGAFRSDPRFMDFVERARRSETIVVRRDDGRQLVGAADLAHVIAKALETQIRGTYATVAREHTTWESIARAIIDRVGTGQVVVEDALATAPWFDTTKLERDLGLVLDARDAVSEHLAHLLRPR